jgi:hypothetical protein
MLSVVSGACWCLVIIADNIRLFIRRGEPNYQQVDMHKEYMAKQSTTVSRMVLILVGNVTLVVIDMSTCNNQTQKHFVLVANKGSAAGSQPRGAGPML